MKRNIFINEISEYHDILGLQIQKETENDYFYFGEPYSEKEWVYHDILNYEDNNYEDWTTKDFIDFIKYLERLTGLTTKLGDVIYG